MPVFYETVINAQIDIHLSGLHIYHTGPLCRKVCAVALPERRTLSVKASVLSAVTAGNAVSASGVTAAKAVKLAH